MKALLATSLDGIENLRYTDVPRPAMGSGMARVEVAAAGVNFADILMLNGRYQHQQQPPFIPGMEFSGSVVEVADGSAEVTPGDRVFGFAPHGAFAEEILTPTGSLQAIPSSLSNVAAAALPITYGTAWFALVSRAGLRADETLLVLGASGGAGTAAIQVGKAVGAHVVATVSSVRKRDTALISGADECIVAADAEELDAGIKSVVSGRVDVAYDTLGGGYTRSVLRSMSHGGRHLVVGFASGEIPDIQANRLLLKNVSSLGVSWPLLVDHDPTASRSILGSLAKLADKRTLTPAIDRTFPASEGVAALDWLRQRQSRGKVLIVFRD